MTWQLYLMPAVVVACRTTWTITSRTRSSSVSWHRNGSTMACPPPRAASPPTAWWSTTTYTGPTIPKGGGTRSPKPPSLRYEQQVQYSSTLRPGSLGLLDHSYVSASKCGGRAESSLMVLNKTLHPSIPPYILYVVLANMAWQRWRKEGIPRCVWSY